MLLGASTVEERVPVESRWARGGVMSVDDLPILGITMGDADLLPEHFASLNAICAYVRSRESGHEAAHG